MIKVEKYLKNVVFPSRDIDPDKKDELYHKQWAEAIYSLWLQNKTAWGYDLVNLSSYFRDLRLLASGNQDPSQYKSFLTGVSPQTQTEAGMYDDSPITKRAKREGWYHLLWQNLSPASKIMNSIHGMLDKFDFDILADTIDSDSRGMVEFEKYKRFFESKEREFINEYKKNAGIPIDEEVDFPKTKEELDAFEAREGFKLNIAKAMQKLLRYSFKVSDWDGEIRKNVLDDLVITGYGCVGDIFNKETNRFELQYLDPENTVIQYSRERGYKDSEYGGYFSLWTISNVRRMRPDVDEDYLRSMAKKFMGQCGNPSYISNFDGRESLLDPATKSYVYDDFKVPVFWAVWIDTDSPRRLYYTGANGRETVKTVSYDKEIKSLTGKQKERGFKQEVRKVPVRLVRQVYWVVDTDICWDSGKLHMAARPENSKPVLPIHAEQLLQPSLMYRLKPILDNIALTWLTYQNSLAKMVERGHAVNMGMLMGIALGGKQLDPSEVLTMWKQTGFLPYMYNFTNQYTGGAATPVTPIEGGMGKRTEEVVMALNLDFKLIEDIVGINPLMLGGSPDPKAPVATSEAALRATSNILKPIIDGVFELKEAASQSLMCRLQVGLRVSEAIRRTYSGIVPPQDIKAMIMAESSGAKYGIFLKARPSEQMLQELKGYMMAAVERGELAVTEAMYFSERMASGEDLMDIRQEMSYSIEKEQQRKAQEQIANIQAQNQGLQQLEQQKQQGEMGIQQMKMEEEVIRGQIKQNLLKAENNYALMNKLYDLAAQEEGLTPQTSRR